MTSSGRNSRPGHVTLRGIARLLIACGWLATALATACSANEFPAAARFREKVQPILETYCYGCHGYGTSEGGRTLDAFASDEAILADRALWWAALKNVRAGIMPPAGEERPNNDERRQLFDWIKFDALGIDPANPDPGRVTLRRLNRTEYRNTIRDLFDVDYNTSDEFPADDSGYGFDNIRNSGNCDSGYSCAYQYNVSWRSATTPMPPERNPRLVFERLFGSGSRDERRKNLELRREQQRSILDFIRDDARSLAGKVSTQDGRKLDEYLTSIREIEPRIARVELLGELPNPDYDTPEGVPDPFADHMRVMYDMIVLAFQTDSTRIATLIVSHDGSNRAYPEVGVDRGHHDLSHHGGDQEKLEMIAKIDKYHMQHFAEFLDKLANSHDADGNSILHNSMIAYTGGNADGNAHSHTNLPMILAGKGGGVLQTGRFHQLQSIPMSNMFLDMLDSLGIAGIDQFGDSDGRRAAI